MKIDVTCPDCDAKYRVGEEHAGKKIRCKQCKSVVEIPAAAATDDEFSDDQDEFSWDEAPAPKRTTSGGLPPRVRRKPEEKAPREIPRQKPKWEGGSGTNYQLVIALVGGAAIIGLMIAGLFKPGIALWGGIALLGVGNLFTYFHAVENDCGLWYRFIPFYSVYYTLTNVAPLWHWLVIRIGGGLLLIIAIVLQVRDGVGGIAFDDFPQTTEYHLMVYVWTVDLPDSADDDPAEVDREFESPSAETIRDELSQLPWDDPKLAFEVMLSSPAEENGAEHSLSLVRGMASVPVDQPPRIFWDHWELDGAGDAIQQSPPLKSADEAIPIMSAFAADDPNWQSMLTWEPVSDDVFE